MALMVKLETIAHHHDLMCAGRSEDDRAFLGDWGGVCGFGPLSTPSGCPLPAQDLFDEFALGLGPGILGMSVVQGVVVRWFRV